MGRLRLAFFSPYRPQRSGIADYSEDLLPDLGNLADVDLVAGAYRLSNEAIARRFRVRTVAGFLAAPAAYDAAIYQVGNNLDHHGYMTTCMRRAPGILVLHDDCLQYLVLGLTVRAGNFGALVEALEPSFGRKARTMALRLLLNLADPNRISFAWPLIAMNRAVIVHSRLLQERVLRDFPNKPVRVIPMGVPLEEPRTAPAALRSRFRLGEDDFVAASISTLAQTKRLTVTLRSLPEIKARLPRLKYLVVGGGSFGAEARKLIRDLGLQDTVTVTGWVSHEDYRGLIALADAIVDLRYPSGGETSASISRAMAIGKPLIVSDRGSFRELPDGCCVRVPVDANEAAALRDALVKLASDAPWRARMSATARAYAETHLGLPRMARSYVDFAAEVADAGPQPAVAWPSREPAALSRRLISSVYKAARVAYLYRNYGWHDTLARIREELRMRPDAVTQP